jgi:ABC-type branched-subunit amino acid transport system ATPase component
MNQALRGIDLEVRPREITAIIGSNGAGKTSTLMAISGLVPVSGEVLLEGQSIIQYTGTSDHALGISQILRGDGCSPIKASRTTCCWAPTPWCAGLQRECAS